MSQYVVPNPERNIRPVQELMSMDSYQDMSDAEILSVIQYREQMASLKALNAERGHAAEILRENEAQRTATAYEESRRMLEYYMNVEIPWVTVDGGESK